MGWNAEIENSLEVVGRIIATLFALAALAERASRPSPSNGQVLRILGVAEDVASAFVFRSQGVGADAQTLLRSAAADPAFADGGRCSPLQLAISLRNLALALGVMLLKARRFCRRSAERLVAVTELFRATASARTHRALAAGPLDAPIPDT